MKYLESPKLIKMSIIDVLSRVWLFVTLWNVACQAPLSMEFSKQEYWSKMSCPTPGNIPDPGIKLTSLVSTVVAGGFFTTSATYMIDNPPERVNKKNPRMYKT